MNISSTTVSASDEPPSQEFTLNNANSSVIELISGSQAIGKLQQADDFITNLSRFDLESRLHSSSATLEDYFLFITQHILDWNKASSKSISSCIEYLNTQCLNQLKVLTFPPRIFIVLTDGQDENDAAYCRSEDVIVIPQSISSSTAIRSVFIHELFHIWSKWNTNLSIRDQLYASIGYHRIPVDKPLEFPVDLCPMKITNPDAPLVMKYYINLKKRGDSSEKTLKCTPILHATRAFDVDFSRSFFDYLDATTVILDDITYEPLQPLQYFSYKEASDFYDQIGNNTQYIIHPEEILADNFVLWITDAKNSRT